jgi:hypothetical protein
MKEPIKLATVICINCKKEGVHFVRPSYDKRRWYWSCNDITE